VYRRMYGTHHHAAARNLIPIQNEPWLRAKSEAPLVLRWFFGATGVILTTLCLGGMGWIPAAPHPLGGILLLLSALATMVVLICLILLVGTLLRRDLRQYCPECLSYMTRGAKVCPFCGFRPEAPPRSAPQQSLTRQQARE
jgi:hypothetical protein